ncbi:MAG: DUF4870 domain-containing protein [Sphingobacteriaceae bacterium]|nr:MAG: DUF4870 domain-containing protein [Sphingobacteriaceae bacterium]
MSNKTLAIVSYITIIGWAIAFFQFKDQKEKSPLVGYHLKQALGLAIISILLSVLLTIVVMAVPSLYFLAYLQYAVLILWVLGIINAANEVYKPVPVVGSMFQDKFGFIA